MGWSAPHTFVSLEVVTPATMNTYVSNNLSDLDRRTSAAGSNPVNTTETTTSTSYTDLTTVGPTANSVVVGSTGLCLVTVSAAMVNSGASGLNAMGFAISGATTQAASDNLCVAMTGTGSFQQSATYLLTITPGSNTFTAKYRVTSGTGTFSRRNIIAVPLGS